MPEELKGVNLDEPEEDNEDGSLEKTGKLFINIMIVSFMALFIGLAIDADDKTNRIICFVIVLILLISLIKTNKKNKKGGYNES